MTQGAQLLTPQFDTGTGKLFIGDGDDYPDLLDLSKADGLVSYKSDPLSGMVEISINGSKLKCENVTGLIANDDSAATANVIAIQAALDVGGRVQISGGGYIAINAPLLIGDDTHLDISPEVEIRLVGGVVKNLLRTKATDRAINGISNAVTLTWTAGDTCAVAWAAHGKTAGDYVMLFGTGVAPSNFNGVFQIISVTDANNFVVRLWMAPPSAPTGTSSGYLVNKNVTVSGGLWNQQYLTVNGGGAVAMNHHLLMLGCCAHLEVKNIRGRNTYKYLLHMLGVVDGEVDSITVDTAGGGDVVKLYGPMVSVSATRITGNVADDIITVQAKEPAAYLQYMYAWGDVLNVSIAKVSGNTSTSLTAVYGSAGQNMSGISVADVSGHSGYGVYVESSEACTLGNVELSNIHCSASSNQIAVVGGPSSSNISSLKVKSGRHIPRDFVGSDSAYLYIDNYWTVENFVLESPDFYNPTLNTLPFYIVTNGVIRNATVSGGRVESAGNGSFWQNNGTITNMLVTGLAAKSLSKLFSYMANVSQAISFVGCTFDMYAHAVSVKGPTKVFASGNNFTAMDLGLLRTDTAATCSISSGGNNFWGASAPVYTVGSASGTISLYGWDLSAALNAAWLARTAGSYCKASANVGTILANNLVVCDATGAANSWKQLSNPALQY